MTRQWRKGTSLFIATGLDHGNLFELVQLAGNVHLDHPVRSKYSNAAVLHVFFTA